MQKNKAVILTILLIAALALMPACFAEASPEPTEAPAPMEVEFGTDFAPYDGIWVPFEDGFKLYLPRDWAALDVTDEQAAAGLFYLTVGDLPDGSAMAVGVSYFFGDGLEDLDDLAAVMAGRGCENLTPLVLNGIPVVWMDHPGNDYRGVTFFHPSVPGCALTVYVSPFAEYGTSAGNATAAVLYSLSPYPAE